MDAYFNRFILNITYKQACECSHAGDCTQDVIKLAKTPMIRRQLMNINPDDIRDELKDYGAWDSMELEDNVANELRILWIAAGDIKEYRKERYTK